MWDSVKGWLRWNWPLAMAVLLIALLVWLLAQISAGKAACYAKGYEFEAEYLGGKTICIEMTNGTRTIHTLQR